MKQIKFCVLIISLLVSNTAFALRCGLNLVRIGEQKHEVYNRCGEPESIEVHIERRGSRSPTGLKQYYSDGRNYFPNNSYNKTQQIEALKDVNIEEWIYNFGSSSPKQYLRFENSKLVEIKDFKTEYCNGVCRSQKHKSLQK